MIDEKLIKSLGIEDIGLLDAASLSNQVVIARLEELSTDPVLDFESGDAREFYETLDTLVRENEESLKKSEPAYDRLAAVLWGAYWKALPSMSDQGRKNILTTNLVFSLKHGINVKSYLQKLQNIYEFGLGPDEEGRRQLAYALEANQERLGGVALSLAGGERAAPQVKNWVKDYLTFAARAAKRGKFEQINYLNASPNVRNLSLEEKEILSKVIDIYDWIKFGSSASIAEEKQVYMKKERLVAPLAPKTPTPAPRPVSKTLPPPPLPTRVARGPFVGTEEPKNERTQEPSSPPKSTSLPGAVAPGPLPSSAPTLRSGSGERSKESANEELYRETLEELAKMRKEEQQSVTPPGRPAAAGRPPSPLKEREVIPPPRPVSIGDQFSTPIGVNEALISAGVKKPLLDQGSVVPGEKEVEEKLRKLEEKLK